MTNFIQLSNQALLDLVSSALSNSVQSRAKVLESVSRMKSSVESEQNLIGRIQQTSHSGFRIINRDILYKLFLPFLDMILLNWEILADNIIDDLITEEVHHLNQIEIQQKMPRDEIATLYTAIENQDAKALLDYIKECKVREDELMYKYL